MFVDDIVTRLVAQGVGTYGSNIIAGSKGVIPTGDGPILSIIATGGSAPTRIHNEDGAHTQRPTAQILVRAKLSSTAWTMARAAYVALDGVFNTTINGVFYQSITVRQEVTDIGLDSVGRPMLTFNVEAEKQPS